MCPANVRRYIVTSQIGWAPTQMIPATHPSGPPLFPAYTAAGDGNYQGLMSRDQTNIVHLKKTKDF